MNEIISQGKKGVGNIAKYFPVMGTIIGGGLAIGSLKLLQKQTKKFRRK